MLSRPLAVSVDGEAVGLHFRRREVEFCPRSELAVFYGRLPHEKQRMLYRRRDPIVSQERRCAPESDQEAPRALLSAQVTSLGAPFMSPFAAPGTAIHGVTYVFPASSVNLSAVHALLADSAKSTPRAMSRPVVC